MLNGPICFHMPEKTGNRTGKVEQMADKKKTDTAEPVEKKGTATKKSADKKSPSTKGTDSKKSAVKAKKSAADVAETAKNTASEAVGTVMDTAKETKDSIVDKAKKAYDDVPTDEFQAKADEVSKKAAETARKAGEAVKSGFAEHGIDTGKLGSALKKDAKSAATVIVGGAKFASEKFGELMGNLHEKLDDTGKKGDPEDK